MRLGPSLKTAKEQRASKRASPAVQPELRYELIPTEGAAGEANSLPPGTRVSVTCSPSFGLDASLGLAERLAARGLEVIPHLSARLIESEEHLEDVVRRLEATGIREVFVIGGDSEEPAGSFSSGAELLGALAGLDHGLERIGVPAYPEPHPLIEEEALFGALLEKQRFASYAVTQICFDPGAVLRWIEWARERGFDLPVYVGIPGVVGKARLLRISMKIGLGDSLRYLTKQRGLAGRLFGAGAYRPDELIDALLPYMGDTRYGLAGFHINTFNQVSATQAWLRKRGLFQPAG
ncbi:methylenetetrahydrofolate reductase [Rubrobacter aplysinae]|uniref:methylenetetrahydrofolate reductase n=1 Tax=Rubrobacter aplysinae TaxID=909625 RepID=UPI001364D2D4|nr:methylenetetrahydrofolate reductase [Rubrobacter aplysinae]